ncbi:flagellar basal body-associated protein FliL [Pseudomonas sp. L-22-4S-12]|jgi:flagellar FliL protein|uniref:flagellar basal body-associated protein FliL n=1 Tax=unclassified Pseudomonas TaxID=196821 RepID=UPI00132260A2|nr:MULTISPECIES: flagellar basal body-associated protein FliL [unclassified Pseudomonas]MWV12580.1 flagellar basal body-associated protein FliL [Pseudomonas sp. R-28-1W-6]MWV16818.1 flagellar basal body-associated protein FliL [Pseudomonas sp. L-22-4S-12]
MAKKQAPQPPTDGDKPAGKSKLKLIILIVVALLLAVSLSVGATLFFLGKQDDGKPEADAEQAAETTPVKKSAIYEQIAPAFIVNFNYQGRQRYMQVSVALMARDQAELDALKVHMPVLRNRLVMLFSGQDYAALITPVGKEMLRQQATTTVQELAQKETGKMVVEQVLFTNLVLQ